MHQKNNLRKRYFNLRKKKYYEIDKEFFSPLLSLIKSNFKKKNLKLALYYPASFEINVLKLLENKYMSNKIILLPVIEKNNLGNPQQKKLFDCQSKEELIPPISLLSKAEMQSTKISEKTLSYISGLIEMRLKDFSSF